MISMVYHFRDQPHMLLRHMMEWTSLHFKNAYELILIDDCSKNGIDYLAGCSRWPFTTRIAKVTTDMEWNYGCKNLGVNLASKPWVFLTNMDHMLPRYCYDELVELAEKAPPKTYYRFNRAWDGGDHDKYDGSIHIGTLLIRRDDWMAIGGIDEDFSGYYGHDDTLLEQCLRHRGYSCVVPKNIELVCFADGRISDADFKNDPEWSRDTDRNDQLLAVKQNQLEDGVYRNTPPLRFEWELLK